ncbi:meiotic W68 [Leptinotarsa decemlineata]|uniref:meiotic W68 n=1 Tax=Leptinotarsa decemlineata TaxID=7539 RepID=UPI003D309764
MSVIKSNVQRSRAKFKLILCILKKIQTLLETNTKLTKRELYYQLKSLIGDQRVTDRAINAISCLLDVGMWALNIVAQKGLVFGNLKILLASGEILNCNVPGTLIPQDVNEIIELHSSAYFILVIEKESIFHKLIEENLPNKLTRPFIMITGKGFPDLNTQLFLRRLWVAMSIPVFILVDADPDGISIMLNYRFGSVKNAHVSHHLAVPKAKWLGVFPSELRNFSNNIQPLSEREVKLAEDLLKTPYMAENPEIVRELKVLIEKKRKAGIEGLIKSNVFLSEVYFPAKFFSHDFI